MRSEDKRFFGIELISCCMRVYLKLAKTKYTPIKLNDEDFGCKIIEIQMENWKAEESSFR